MTFCAYGYTQKMVMMTTVQQGLSEVRKVKMRFDKIMYSIEPSFADRSICEIETNPRNSTYAVTVNDGNGHREIQATADTILPILDAVKRLSLPVPTDVAGCDGTFYSLKVGVFNSVTYTWWG